MANYLLLSKMKFIALCLELKIQMKYGAGRKKVGSFGETFGIKGKKSPSLENMKKLKHSKKYRKFKNKGSNEQYYKKKSNKDAKLKVYYRNVEE